MYILGISAFYHDSAACLIRDGEIVAAAQEERFTREKHDFSFPHHAVTYCLNEEGLSLQEISSIAYYENPHLKFDRILQTYLAVAPLGLAMVARTLPPWITKKLWVRQIIQSQLGYNGEVHYCDHHESHAASAFFPSPFQDAAILTVDGVGEWDTTTLGHAYGNHCTILKEIRFPHSLGLLYSAFTYYTGFKVNSGEYKVMGLAPYGEPHFVDIILEKLVDLKEDGSFRLNMDYFGYLNGLTMTNEKFNGLFEGPPRNPEGPLTQKEMDLARSIQEVTEEIMMRMSMHLHDITGSRNLCLAGGVALNCVANGKIFKKGPFKEIWIQPAAGDAGGAVGAALQYWHQVRNNPRTPKSGDAMKGAYLGPSYSNDQIEHFLKQKSAPAQKMTDEHLIDMVSDLLADGNVIGLFQGRMEFGPRALGNRSIIADSRNREMQKKLNLKIKFRESFRPFAPSVIREKMSDYFDIDYDSPYMLLVANVKESRRYKMTPEQERLFGIERLNIQRSDIPAVTHLDYSARIQTVHAETNPRYYGLIRRFGEKTGYPVLVNTSFNVRGEPIVCTPEDAYRCFMRTGMDFLVLENFLLNKNEQPTLIGDTDWKNEFALD
ncbi:MAG: carbamoyltransferase [Methanoregula sp.]|nr:carbamoyltransferase [Methanoregula sp.]